MTQYLLSVYHDGAEATPSAEVVQQMYADVETLNQKMRDSGAWVFAGGLHTADTATVVRREDGEVVTTDGPLPEAREQIGGFWVIEADDLDAALDWASQATVACRGPVEIRPFQDGPRA